MAIAVLEAKRRRLSIRLALKVGVILIALCLALFPFPAAWIEHFYSNGMYPRLQSILTPLSNLIPFAIADVLIVALALGLPVWWIARLRSAGRGRRLRALRQLAFNTLFFVACVYLTFLLLWGFNYVRKPLAAKLEYDEQRITPQALNQLTRLAIERLNAESAVARAGPWPDEMEWRRQLLASFNPTVTEIGGSRGIAPGNPKHSLFDFYLGTTGTEGFVNPFALEVVLDKELLPVEKPFTLAHEWAHLAGFADESEASFVGLLACLRSEAAALRYAGWLALYQHLPRQSGQADLPRLAPEVTADLRAIAERVNRRISPTLQQAQAQVYDGFLKANRVEAGIASYGLMLRLVLGTRFEPEWTPAMR